jgi:sterol desaturase/sphingolipid hydroxylase (fatty acid hydroxylase superfamily)
MQSIIDFFNDISSLQRTLILASGFVLMWMIESIVPLIKNLKYRYGHTGINLFFTLTTLIVNFLFAFLLVKASDFTTLHHFGILYLINLPTWLHALLGLMFLDLIGAYFIHWIEHNIKWMWKFHIIHHTDPHVNATTALRHHPGESVFRAVFAILGILIAGVPIWVVMIYQTASAFLSQFNHANINLPKWLDRSMQFIFVSPNMHKVHHHSFMPITDTNYGNIFSLWDRLFGTFKRRDTFQIEYGLDTHPEEDAHSWLPRLLKIPFEPYRPPRGSKFSREDDVDPSPIENKSTVITSALDDSK